jgi:protein-disulfide isomerase
MPKKKVDTEQNQNTSILNKYMLPISIIVAGVIIGMAIFISSRGTSNTTQNLNNTNSKSSASASQTTPTNNTNTNTVTVSLGSNPVLGNTKTAKVGIVEFGDFQCPYCKEFNNSAFPTIQSNYINNGKIIYSFRNYPLTTIHPLSLGMAQESGCFGEQGKFWKFVSKMYSTNQDTNTPNVVAQYAKAMGLNMTDYNNCVQNDPFQSKIQNDINAGNRINLQGTPSFVIGKYKNNKVTGQIILGSRAVSYYETILSQYLN